GGAACAWREAVRHRQFPQLLRDIRRVRAGRSGSRRRFSEDARAAAVGSGHRRAMKPALLFLLLFIGLLGARLCHVRIMWAEENLPIAAASQMKLGKTLYRDIWFDKPPLLAAIYLLWGARPDWPLRVSGALYAWLACVLAYRFAGDLWGADEARWAATLLAFF